MSTFLPDDLTAEFNADARAAGYTSKRTDSPRSRWHYFRKILLLGRQHKDLISLPKE